MPSKLIKVLIKVDNIRYKINWYCRIQLFIYLSLSQKKVSNKKKHKEKTKSGTSLSSNAESDDSDDSNNDDDSISEDSEVEETDKGLYVGPEDEESPVEKPNVPIVSSDKWLKIAHVNELTSVATRVGTHKTNLLTTLPQFEPGERHKKGSLVQTVEHEVPVESADQYFQLMFTAEIVEAFVINT